MKYMKSYNSYVTKTYTAILNSRKPSNWYYVCEAISNTNLERNNYYYINFHAYGFVLFLIKRH